MFNIADLSKEDRAEGSLLSSGRPKLDHRGAADCAPTILKFEKAAYRRFTLRVDLRAPRVTLGFIST